MQDKEIDLVKQALKTRYGKSELEADSTYNPEKSLERKTKKDIKVAIYRCGRIIS